ncbi:hypothetical protein EMPS_00151 [Entomortierella parvispora]|uniref:Ndc10 domain-containing protein n=1 Tax=Entomortierella parvispora TaxID=205924 RepID=A0A9P3GZJ4_9FUNG|nr:hypothetical protein EMPS_00151 [Entomortierella parvispora]
MRIMLSLSDTRSSLRKALCSSSFPADFIMPRKAPTSVNNEGPVGDNARQQASVSGPGTTDSPAKRRGRPPKATVATRTSTVLSTESLDPVPTEKTMAASAADLSTLSAPFSEAVPASQSFDPASTPPATSAIAHVSSTRPFETTEQETSDFPDAVEIEIAAAVATGRGKRRQEETQPDDAAINEKRAKKPILKLTEVTTGPPSSANGWNKPPFSPSAFDDQASISLTEEVVLAKRKESARVVLEDILNRPPTKTIQAYKTYFKLWKTFCDMNYDGDSTVSPTRMLKFFEKVVFERKVRKVVNPNAGYSGQIGIAAPGAGLREGRKAARNKELDTRASNTMSSPMATSADVPAQSGPLPLDVSTEVAINEEEAVDRENVNISRSEDEPGSEAEAEDLSVEEQSSTDAVAESLISSITDKNKGEKDAYGNTIILVPVGHEAVDMARKALIFLWKEQCSRLAPLPSIEPNPRKDIPLMRAIEDYEVKLVCTVGGFAFYMFERFEVEKEPLPDFSKPDEWHRVTILVGGSVKDRVDPSSSHFRLLSLDPKTQNDSTSAVMRSCQVYSLKVTRTGRRAGLVEAYNLGLGLEDIRHLGRWSMGQMEAVNAPRNPVNGAFAMAHFQNEPYFVERDLVTPPLELQRKIFSWIEKTFDVDHPELRDSWIEDCQSQMKAIDPTEPTEDDLHYMPPRSDSNEKTGEDLVQSAAVDRKAFLQLLVRLRRVILQDAVIFRRKDSQGRTLTNSLITSRPDIFESPLFLKFEADLLAAIEKRRQHVNLLPREITVDVEVVVGAVNGLADKVQQLAMTTSALQATLNHDQTQDLAREQLRHLQELMRSSMEFYRRTEMALWAMSVTMPLPPLQRPQQQGEHPQQQQGEHPQQQRGEHPQQRPGEHLPSGPDQQQDHGPGLIYFQPPPQQQPHLQQTSPQQQRLDPTSLQQHLHQQQSPNLLHSQWIQSLAHPPRDSWWPQPLVHTFSDRPLARPRLSLKCKSKRSLKEVYHDYLVADNGMLGDDRTHRRRKALFRDIEKLQKKSDKDMSAFLDELDKDLKAAASVKAFTTTIRERAANI